MTIQFDYCQQGYLMLFGLFETVSIIDTSYPSPILSSGWCEGYRANLYHVLEHYNIHWEEMKNANISNTSNS